MKQAAVVNCFYTQKIRITWKEINNIGKRIISSLAHYLQ